MGREIGDYEPYVNHLFTQADRDARAAVNQVLDEATAAGQLTNSRTGLVVAAVIETVLKATIEEALRAYDKTKGSERTRQPLLERLKERVSTYMRGEARQIRRGSKPFSGGRNAVTDAELDRAEVRLLAIVDAHVHGYDETPPPDERRPIRKWFADQGLTALLSAAVTLLAVVLAAWLSVVRH